MSESYFKVVPLGGLGRVGGNLMAYETPDDLFVVDCGVLFPGENEPGIDYVIPNIAYLKERKEKFRGYVITHAHEDHFGALPFTMPELNGPIFATHFTKAFIEHRLSERGLKAPKYHTIEDRKRFQVGKLTLDPIPITHSIVGQVSLAIHTPLGVVIHTSDFKFDDHPCDDRHTDFEGFESYGNEGVLALLSDSTNSEQPGTSRSEGEVREHVMRIIDEAPEAVVVTCFSSNIHRLQTIMDGAAASGRILIPVGRSAQNFVNISLKHGYLRYDGEMSDIDKIPSIPRSRLCLLISGSQGEPRSSLTRIAAGQHRVSIEPGDWVIYSARRIPGNERAVGRVYNNLIERGARIIDERVAPVHASGHAYQDELKRMIEMCRPRYFVPLHGEYRHMHRHAQLAHEMGLNPDQTFVIRDGQPILFEQGTSEVIAQQDEEVAAGYVYVDGSGVGDLDGSVLKARRQLSESGVVFCTAVWSERTLLDGPKVVTKGVLHREDEETATARAEEVAAGALLKLPKGADIAEKEEVMRVAVRRFFRTEYERNPVVLPYISVV